MPKKFSFFRFIFIAILLVSLFSCSSSSYLVTRVVDGDTIELSNGTRIRYIGINTPEYDQHLYKEAKDLNYSLVKGKNVFLEYDQEMTDSFGRTLAYVFTSEGFINEIIVQEGLARKFFISPNTKYMKIINRAENEAREKGENLFKSSGYSTSFIIPSFHYDAEGDDRINLNDEWFILENISKSTIPIQGFYFFDESNHQVFFPAIDLSPGQSIKVHTGIGENTTLDIYAGLTSSIWNNSGDTLYLYDSMHGLILEESY